jgi:hypothetical protein
MIDFTEAPRTRKLYPSVDGLTDSIIYEGKPYMLKFPMYVCGNTNAGYNNNCISEYLGCKIFESIGLPVQEVLLGTCTLRECGQKIVVACKDYAALGVELLDFLALKNSAVELKYTGNSTNLEDILPVFKKQIPFSTNEMSDYFWDMFIADALIGNWDRGNERWGFLYESQDDSISLAPIFGCCNNVFLQIDELIAEKDLDYQQGLQHWVYNAPLSVIRYKKEKINYCKLISSLEFEECNNALERIVPRISLEKINDIINSVSFIDDRQKSYYKMVIANRKELILDNSLEKLHGAKRGEQYEFYRIEID